MSEKAAESHIEGRSRRPSRARVSRIQLDINREMARCRGVSSKEAVNNVITALTSDSMIAPSYWVDPKNGNNYMLTVQYPETQVKSLTDLKQIPLHAAGNVNPTDLDAVSDVKMIKPRRERRASQSFRCAWVSYHAKLSAGRGRDGDHFASGQCGRSYLRGSRHAPGNIGASFSVPICPEVPNRGTRLALPNYPGGGGCG